MEDEALYLAWLQPKPEDGFLLELQELAFTAHKKSRFWQFAIILPLQNLRNFAIFSMKITKITSRSARPFIERFVIYSKRECVYSPFWIYWRPVGFFPDKANVFFPACINYFCYPLLSMLACKNLYVNWPIESQGKDKNIERNSNSNSNTLIQKLRHITILKFHSLQFTNKNQISNTKVVRKSFSWVLEYLGIFPRFQWEKRGLGLWGRRKSGCPSNSPGSCQSLQEVVGPRASINRPQRRAPNPPLPRTLHATYFFYKITIYRFLKDLSLALSSYLSISEL